MGIANRFCLGINIQLEGLVEHGDALNARPREFLHKLGQVGEIGAHLDADGDGHRFANRLDDVGESALHVVGGEAGIKRHDSHVKL